ncbi:sigma factor-like helix-turn-helix DNA-binding protein [Mariniluteicoccus endophyticus]
MALSVVLDHLSPAERIAFVLHDIFDVPFAQIARILDTSAPAARQLASRGRQRARNPRGAPTSTDFTLVEAFLRASRQGDFDSLLAILAPDARLDADAAACALGAHPMISGANDVAHTFSGRARGVQLTQIQGAPGAVWMHRRQPQILFTFTIHQDHISEIHMVADSDTLHAWRTQLNTESTERVHRYPNSD